MKRGLIFALAMVCLVLPLSQAGALLTGDVNNNQKVEMDDAIIALQAAANLRVVEGADLGDAVAALQILAGITQSGGDTVTNALGMTFNRIPAGTFMMGSPSTEPGRDSDEVQHQVTLTNDFYMQTTEVTQGQWQAVMGSNPSYFPACGSNCPVENVSWYDVQTFITALNARGEGTYRLPTDAQWEYAARAGSTTAFYNGSITNTGTTPLDPNLDAIGWYGGNSAVTYTPNYYGQGTHPVAQKQPNAYGLYDMSGNVGEWCQDWYQNYSTASVTNPTGPSTGTYRVLRGRAWTSYAADCRSAFRSEGSPSNRRKHNGFRLLLSP
ncbi:MAG: formylglycine-generating enzyme family protein [Desulfococcaceae bacterium]|jgi:formylglycine-generating enzyme required for sulfatase activity|nr:formylglycine-generating enzyme family protein [Desulfococcaceae bacterium]